MEGFTTKDQRAAVVEALTEALSKIAAIQNLEDDESPLDDEELMADIRHVLCDLQDLCISCPVLYCQPCMNMKYAFSVLHYFITPRDVITEDVKRLALPRDPKMKLEERIAADRHDMATLMESWVLGSIYSLYSAVSTNEIGELPNSLPPRVVAARTRRARSQVKMRSARKCGRSTPLRRTRCRGTCRGVMTRGWTSEQQICQVM